jgi:hypothetical protein
VGFGSVRALAQDVTFEALAVAGTVTRPNEPAIEARVLWVTPSTESLPGGGGFQRREARRGVALLKSEVASVPAGTIILAPELEGGESKRWKVEGPDVILPDQIRVIVVAAPLEE